MAVGRLNDFYDVVLGDREGIVCVAFGRRPFRTDRGKFKHAEWQEMRYDWPVDRAKLLADIERESVLDEPVDVYLAPAVRGAWAKGRRKGDALPPVSCWADLDNAPADPHLHALLVEMGALLVSSGSPGSQHLYLPLTEPVDLGTHQVLNKALAARLGADAKWSDESLLRPPGSYNQKATVPPADEAAGPKVLVTVEKYNGLRIDPAELATLLGVDVAGGAAAPVGRVPPAVSEPVPAVLPDIVQRALDDPYTSDRSVAIARVVGACVRADLTAGQALTVVSSYGPAERYKSGQHMADDVARLHQKFTAERTGTALAGYDSVAQLAGGRGLSTSTPTPGRSTKLPTLPLSFWEARPVHAHIRTAAHSRLASADLVLHAVLAKIAGMSSHELWFDSGRGRSSLNYFAAAVGASGIGKTTGAAAVDDELLPVPGYLRAALDGLTPDPFYDGLPLGSGEGIAESYMGMTEVEVDTKKNGDPIMRKVRAMIRNNVFVSVDEGETFTRLGERTGATVSTTLRSAWVGATIGQANGRDDTTRIIKAHSYSLGMLVGFQPHTALPLLTDTATGTAQRFTWVSASDPTMPDDPVEHPGPISVPLGDEVFGNTARTGTMTFPAGIKAELRRDHIAKIRGELVVDEHDSQAPLMRCKLTALLALLDGRVEVTNEDWDLAAVLWETSCAVRNTVTEQAAQEKARQAELVADARVQLAERTAAAVDGVSTKLDRLAVTLAQHVVEAGGMKRSDARRGMPSRDRHLYEEAVERAAAKGLLRCADGGGLLPPMRGVA